jgi:hypothetical protein
MADNEDVDRADPVDELPLYDQILHGIGRVAQAHVGLEVSCASSTTGWH